MYERVEQKDSLGCAVAAIATVVGLSYDTVLKRAFGRKWRRISDHGLYTAQMVRVLRSYRLKVRKANRFSFRRSGHSAILFANLGVYSPYWEGVWHCLVWDPDEGGRMIDPSWRSCRDHEYYLKAWRHGGRQTLIILP